VKKKTLLALLLGVTFVVSVVLVRTALFRSTRARVEPVRGIAVHEARVAQHLAEAIRFKTVSNRDASQVDWDTFTAFRAFLEKTYPRLHASLERELVHDHSMLFTWRGRDPTLKPVVLMAHYDVVPAPESTNADWVQPAFEGVIADGYVWGRGALDNKSSLMGIFEAVEALLADGFRPTRTVYLVSGHDEEIGGWDGAVKIVELLGSRKVEPEFVLDEGGAIVVNAIPGVRVPVAAVGVSEKGYVTLELRVASEGGHSSTPPHQTAVGVLGKAIAELEANPFPSDMTYSAQFFEYVGPEMPFAQRMIFANLWLFRPLVERIMRGNPSMDASIRTTTAATMFDSGIKENVLPPRATAVVNFRIMPGDSVDAVVERVRSVINDGRVEVRIRGKANEPSPMSSIDTRSYALISKTIRQTARDENLVVAPYLAMAASDARHFSSICPNVYRFLPFKVPPEELKGIHGTNERLSTKNFAQMVRFYYQLLRNCEGL